MINLMVKSFAWKMLGLCSLMGVKCFALGRGLFHLVFTVSCVLSFLKHFKLKYGHTSSDSS
jgi:hypothetical protein